MNAVTDTVRDPLLAARPPAAETVSIRLMAGSGKRIDDLLRSGESRSSFLRVAIEKEMRLRETSGRKR